jgi:Spy/CpxP family protein refolding chaperone
MLKKAWVVILLIFMITLPGLAAELKNAVEQEQFELDTLLDKKTVDDTKVRKQFKRLERARTDLANERLGFVIRVREIIGPDRFQQLKSSYKKWR